jgi:hypothetical protein
MLFWAASALASIASVTLEFIVSLYAFDITGSAALFGFILAIVIVPRLLLYPVAGVVADRYNRKLLLVVPTALVFLALSGFAAWHFLFAGLAVPHLFGLVFTLEIFNIVFFTVSAVIPPMIVPEELLGVANSFGIVYSEAGYFIGILLGSLVYAALGFGMSLLSVTGVFALCFACMLFLRLPKQHTGRAQGEKAPKSHFFNEFVEGALIILQDKLVLRILIISPIFHFLFIPLWDLVFLFFLRGDMGMGVTTYGIFMAAQSVSDILAALIAAKLYTDVRAIGFFRVMPWVLFGSMVIIFASAVFASVMPMWLVLVLAFIGSNVIAVVFCFYMISKNTLVQKRVGMEKQSRVFSINRLTGLVMVPIGNSFFGLAVEHFGVVITMVFIGIGSLFILFAVRPLRASWLTDEAES